MATYNFDHNHDEKIKEKSSLKTKKPVRITSVMVSKGSLLGSIIILIISITMLILSVKVFNNTDGYTTVQAEITKIATRSRGGDSDTYVIVKYTVDGLEYERELPTYEISMHTGQILTIYYRPDNPYDIKYVDTATKVIPIVLCSVGIASGVGFGGGIIYQKIKNKKIEKETTSLPNRE